MLHPLQRHCPEVLIRPDSCSRIKSLMRTRRNFLQCPKCPGVCPAESHLSLYVIFGSTENIHPRSVLRQAGNGRRPSALSSILRVLGYRDVKQPILLHFNRLRSLSKPLTSVANLNLHNGVYLQYNLAPVPRTLCYGHVKLPIFASSTECDRFERLL